MTVKTEEVGRVEQGDEFYYSVNGGKCHKSVGCLISKGRGHPDDIMKGGIDDVLVECSGFCQVCIDIEDSRCDECGSLLPDMSTCSVCGGE